MHYFMSTEKQPELINQLIKKHGDDSPWSPAYFFLNTRAQVLKLQGFWYRSDIICGTNNMHSMKARYDTLSKSKIPNDYTKWKNIIILKPETPFEVLEEIRKIENNGHSVDYDITKPETFSPIRKENFEKSPVYEIVKPWLAENQILSDLFIRCL